MRTLKEDLEVPQSLKYEQYPTVWATLVHTGGDNLNMCVPSLSDGMCLELFGSKHSWREMRISCRNPADYRSIKQFMGHKPPHRKQISTNPSRNNLREPSPSDLRAHLDLLSKQNSDRDLSVNTDANLQCK